MQEVKDEPRGPVSSLIWEVSQKPILYDPRNIFYKDNVARQKAWRHVAEKMKMPVTDCQIKWSTLRRCLANARKRQMRRQAIGSKNIKKWRYQDEMSFLLPFIDRKEYEYMNVSRRSAKSVEYEDISDTNLSQDMYISEEYEPSDCGAEDGCTDVKPNNHNLQMFTVENVTTTETEKDRQERANMPVDQMFIEEDEIENYNTTGREWPLSIHRSSYERDPNLSREIQTNELLMDEMDTFFLSMSKALKKLPPMEQIKVRSQVYNLVTRAEVNWLQKSNTPSPNSKDT